MSFAEAASPGTGTIAAPGAITAAPEAEPAPVRATAPTVSVVICAYADERRELLADAVASALGGTRRPHEVVVVVDHNPALLAWARQALAEARVLASAGTPGLADARNCGLRAATGEIVAFLDDDTRADTDWLERLAAAYADPAVIGTGGEIRPDFERVRPRWLPDEFDWVVGCSYRGLPGRASPVRNVIGANMSFRRGALVETGGFRPGLGRTGDDGGGCEETELCIRLAAHRPGAVFVYEPQARVLHRVPPPRATLRYFVGRCRAEGVSKARVARACGAGSALRTERHYVRQTLPAGIVAGLRAGLRGDATGFARAGVIVLGLLVTAGGYLQEVRR